MCPVGSPPLQRGEDVTAPGAPLDTHDEVLSRLGAAERILQETARLPGCEVCQSAVEQEAEHLRLISELLVKADVVNDPERFQSLKETGGLEETQEQATAWYLEENETADAALAQEGYSAPSFQDYLAERMKAAGFSPDG